MKIQVVENNVKRYLNICNKRYLNLMGKIFNIIKLSNLSTNTHFSIKSEIIAYAISSNNKTGTIRR